VSRAKGIPEKFTPKKRAKFLAALAAQGFASRAAQTVGVSRSWVFELKKNDPEFGAAWKAAQDEYAELLEAEADRRAYKGVDEPVFYQGEECGKIRKFSDVLLMFRLKALRPEMYADRARHEVTGKDGQPVQVETGLSPAATDVLKRILGDDQD